MNFSLQTEVMKHEMGEAFSMQGKELENVNIHTRIDEELSRNKV